MLKRNSPRVVFKTVLDPLTMMNIPVNDQHPEKLFDSWDLNVIYELGHTNDLLLFLPFKAIFLLCVLSCYGHVVEHTKTIGSAAHTVVSWRSVNTGKQWIDR